MEPIFYKNIFESRYAENIESEILHIPFYINHNMSGSFSKLNNPSPFLRSAKHPGDSVDIGKEISAYVSNHFINKIMLKDLKVHDAYVAIMMEGDNLQMLGNKIFPLSMIYFVNSTSSSLYVNFKEITSGINSSDTIIFDANKSDVRIGVRSTQAIIIAQMEEVNG